jgi:hypothetical protein
MMMMVRRCCSHRILGGCRAFQTAAVVTFGALWVYYNDLALLQWESSARLHPRVRLPKEGAVDAVLQRNAKGHFVQGSWNDRIYPSVKVLHNHGVRRSFFGQTRLNS